MKVHGVHGSPFVRKVLVTLELKGIAYEMVAQMPFSGDQEYLKINPLGKIPTLVDGDLTLGDSKIICQYLEDVHPDPALYPTTPADKARAKWFDDLACGKLAELAAGIFFQRYMRPRAFQQEPDEELIEKIIDKKLPPMLDYLESQISNDGHFFDTFTIADLSVACQFINAGHVGYEVDEARWPNTAALVGQVKSIPVVAAILEKERKALGLS